MSYGSHHLQRNAPISLLTTLYTRTQSSVKLRRRQINAPSLSRRDREITTGTLYCREYGNVKGKLVKQEEGPIRALRVSLNWVLYPASACDVLPLHNCTVHVVNAALYLRNIKHGGLLAVRDVLWAKRATLMGLPSGARA